jgi:23S rRNA (adenine2503-C2)-methyltransferase
MLVKQSRTYYIESMPSIHDRDALEQFCRAERIDAYALRCLRNVFCKHRLGRERALEEIPAAQRAALEDLFDFHALDLHERCDSQLDGATKLLFRTSAGFLIESVVLWVSTGRTALCVSSQVGCAANCHFCATGKMGVAHDLSAAEILDQVVRANELLRDEDRRVRNIVFMGMGEPLHNEAAISEALDVLASPRCFDHSLRRVLVSTVGIPKAMVRLAQRFPDVNIALSLHSVQQNVRERLMPIAGRYSLGELRGALEDVAAAQNHPIMIEYLMLAGVNDTDAEARALADYLGDLPVHINLIPYNPIDDAPDLISSDRAARDAFAEVLRAAGYVVTIRYSLGADIAAACGQLVQCENREVARALAVGGVSDGA